MDELRVLIVDDEAGMRLGAERVLRRVQVDVPDDGGQVGLRCALAASLDEARSQLENGPVDLLFLDYKLPDGTGLDLLAWLKQRENPPLTVMVTAYASLEMAVSTTKSGAWDFLAKPFSPEELRAVAHKAARHILLERQARQLADERRRVRFQFISVLAHELKAPLAVLESYLDLIQRRAAGADLAQYDVFLGRSMERIQGMRKLIFDLLDLTRLESGEKARELVSVDVSRLASQVLEGLQPQARARAISMELVGPPELQVVADASELEILLGNLASNAVKYNRDGGSVTLRLKPDPATGGLLVEVEDTGIGLSDGEQARLFGEFVRIKNEHTRQISGSGLGLSIVRRICALYGGDASVRSQSGVGSVFSASLPGVLLRT